MSAVMCRQNIAVILAFNGELGDTYYGRTADKFGMVDITPLLRFGDKEQWITMMREKYGFSESELRVATREVMFA